MLEPGRANFEFFPPLSGAIKRKLNRLFGSGVLFDISVLKRCLKANIGDITFREAYARSGRVVNIVVAPQIGSKEPPRLLNYLTSPDVVGPYIQCLAFTDLGIANTSPYHFRSFGQLHVLQLPSPSCSVLLN